MRFPVDIPPPPDPRQFSSGIRRGGAINPTRRVPSAGDEAEAVLPLDSAHDEGSGEHSPPPEARPRSAFAAQQQERRQAERRAAKQRALLDTRILACGRRDADHPAIDVEV